MELSARIEGVEELRAKLSALGDKAQRKAVRTAIRKAGNVVLRNVRKRTQKRSGRTRRALAVRVSVTNASESARIGVKQRSGGRAFHLLEKGAAGHAITVRDRKVLAGANIYGRRVRHPGTRARPALGPGFLESKPEALTTFRSEMEKVINEVKGMAG